jgi:hypothetical protein
MNLLKQRIRSKIHMGTIYMVVVAAMIGYKLFEL